MSGAYLRERSVPDSSNDCHSLSRSTYVAVATEAVKNYHGNYARTWYEDEADPDDSSGNYAFQRLRQTLFTPKIDPQFKLQRISDRFAGEIVLGRPESTHKNNNIGPRKCEACSSGEMLAAVADDSLENHLNSELVEFFGEIKRIRVLAERGQQLRADRDDLGVHALKCK